MRGAQRLVFASWLICGLWVGLCQTGSSQLAPDATVYEKFFLQIVRFEEIKVALGTVVLKGRPTDLQQFTLRDATGLTDQESRVLNALASDCEDKLRSSYDRARPLIFDARLRLLESESDAEAVRQLKEFDDEQRQIVLAHVQQLKAAFGNSRFNVLDAFVRSEKQVVSFLPLPKVKAAAPVADGETPRQPK